MAAVEGRGGPGVGGSQAGAAPGGAFERCTWGLVWTASERSSPSGGSVAIAVQPLAGWVELWVFQRDEGATGGFRADTLAPSTAGPGLGYVESAGWSPDGKRLLVAREAWVAGALQRRFEVLRADTLSVEIEARTVERLVAFRRWASPAWRTRTLALR